MPLSLPFKFLRKEDPDAWRLLFVCMGNICRSPTAHGVMQGLVREAGLERKILVSSGGTHKLHPGIPPDPRAQQHARQRGYDLSKLRARQATVEDFLRSDLILVMDRDNEALVQEACPPDHHPKIRRLTEFCHRFPVETIPDPYYGGPESFEKVLDIVEDACAGVLHHVRRGPPPRR